MLAAVAGLALAGCAPGATLTGSSRPGATTTPAPVATATTRATAPATTATRSAPPASPSGPATAASPSGPPTPAATGGSAAQLAALRVAPRAGQQTYRREAFGSGWGRSLGCDVRDLVLARQLQDAVRSRDDRCEIESGTLDDPYTGRRVAYRRGMDPARGLDVDHLVSLRNAWQAGAEAWPRARRQAFANDLGNLQLTPASVNRAKGDAPVDAWVPPNRRYRCTYAQRWIAVKTAWALTVTGPERDVLADLLRTCPPRAG